MRQTRKCTNVKCPSKKDDKGGFTKAGFKTDSKANPYYCPHCKRKLPNYVPDIDINENSFIDPEEKEGDIDMERKNNWMSIFSFIGAAVLIALFVVGLINILNQPTVALWMIIGIIAIGLLTIGQVLFAIDQISTKSDLAHFYQPLYGLAIIFAILSLIFAFTAFNKVNTAVVPDPTDVIVEETVITTAPEEFSLGVPADVNTVDPSVWNEPLQDAVMVTGDGIVYYVQSGKDGSKTLKGKVPDGAYLVLDAFTISKTNADGKLESFTNGNIYVVPGPLDLDANPINYVDGCAQYIGKDGLQNLLDNNIAVKFARGNWDKDKNQWSYEPWAQSNIWMPDGFKYNPLVLTYETDTYPNLNYPTDTSVNK